RPAGRGRADARDRRHPGTPAETNPDLLTVGPPFVPAGDVAPPPARQKRPGPPTDWEAAPGLATWCRASPVDSLRRGVRRRIVENCRVATGGNSRTRPNQSLQQTAAAFLVSGSSYSLGRRSLLSFAVRRSSQIRRIQT